MVRKMLILSLMLWLPGCSDSGPWDGPAGTKMGLEKDQIEKYAVLEASGSNDTGATVYSSKQAPSMNAQADSYKYVFSAEGDLCLVQLLFDDVSQTASPAILELKSKYGVPVKDDKVPRGVIWSAAKYKLGDDLIEISSEFLGSEPNVSAIVSFSYRNIDECTKKKG